MNDKPAIVVIDDFLPNPMETRQFALQQQFFASDYHKGRRSRAFLDIIDPLILERLLNRKIPQWDKHGMNGTFQICLPTDPIVYHTDMQTHAATLYLTPDAPPDSGLSLWRSKEYGSRRTPPDPALFDKFYGGFYDSTKWELVDKIGNIFNRLVIWDGSLVHSASCYFGTTDDTARLFNMSFFDAY